MTAAAPYKNKAHRTAFAKGKQARADGKDRFAPYGADNNQSRYFRRAWLAGYDAEVSVSVTAALSACVDAMRRSDADSDLPPCSDREWDAALAAGTAALAAFGNAGGAA